VEVTFGVDLALRAGVAITRGEAACHLTVRLTWRSAGDDRHATSIPSSDG